MDGYTRCQFCNRVVPVRDRQLAYHITGYEGDRCCGVCTLAKWVEGNSIAAFGRNMLGACMKCGHMKVNPDCTQCCKEKRLQV